MSRDLAPAIQAMSDAIRRAQVNGVFVTSEARLGIPEAGGWTHFWVELSQVHDGLLNASK